MIISKRYSKFFLTLFFVLGVFYFLPQISFAATYYWIGANGASTLTASNWTASNPTSCSGTPASSIASTDIFIFDADCDNGATVDSSQSFAGLTMSSGYTGTVDASGAGTVTIGVWSGTTYFTQSSGTFLAPANLNLYGNVTISSGATFTHNNGTVSLIDTGSTQTFNAPAGTNLWNLTINKSVSSNGFDQFGFTNAITINGDLNLTDGMGDSRRGSGVITVLGNITVGDNWSGSWGGSPLTFSLASTTANQTFTHGSANFNNSLTINKGSMTATFSGSSPAFYGLTLTSGTLDASGVSSVTTYTYSQASGTTFTAPTSTMTVTGTFTLTAGTFNAPPSFSVASTFTYTAGTFNAGSGTVSFTGTNANLVLSANLTLNNVTFAKTTSNAFGITSGRTLFVNGDLNFNDGLWRADSLTGGITAYGNVSVGANWDGFSTTRGTLTMASTTANQTFTQGSASFNNSLTINNSSMTVNLAGSSLSIGALTLTTGTFNANGLDVTTTSFTLTNGTFIAPTGTLTINSGNFTYTAGTFNAGSGTVSFTGTNANVVLSANLTLNNVTFAKTTGNNFGITSGRTLFVNGDLNFNDGLWRADSLTGGITAYGNVSVGANWDGFSTTRGTLTMASTTANQTFTQGSASFNNNLTAATSSSVSLAGTGPTFGGDLTIDGTLDINSLDVSSGTITVNSSGILKLYGGQTITPASPTLNTGSNVTYTDPSTNRTMKSWSYKNLTIDGGSSVVFSLGQNTSSLATTTIISGILSLASSSATTTVLVNNGTLRLQGNEDLSVTTMDTDSGVVEYVGRNIAESLTVKDFGTNDYYTLSINDTNTNKATFVLPSSLKVNGSLYHYSGTLSSASTDLTLGGTNQTVSVVATTTFSTLTKSVTATSTLTFGTTSPILITGTTTLNGVSGGWLSLRSAVASTSWKFDPQTTTGRVFSYLDVQDSNNINATAIDATADGWFVDSGGNTNWNFSEVAANSILTVSRSGTQLSTTSTPITDEDLGGAFTFVTDTGTTNITSIVIKQVGSLNADTNITNLKMYYKQEAGCSATKPDGTTLFGAGSAFVNNISTTTNVGAEIGTDQICFYITYDLTPASSESLLGHSIDFQITNPATDIVVSSGSVETTSTINISGRTIIIDPYYTNSLLSLKVSDPAKDPTVFYLKDEAVWKKEGDNEPIRLTNQNLKVHSLTFSDVTGLNDSGIVRMQIQISNVDIGADPSFLNVTRTYTTTAGVQTRTGD